MTVPLRDQFLHVRVTARERKAIEAVAEAVEMRPSEWMRAALAVAVQKHFVTHQQTIEDVCDP